MSFSNFSKEELDKFDKMAPRWWDLNGPMKPLHQVNPLRLEFIKTNLKNKLNNLSNLEILDIGCGGGILSESMAIDPDLSNSTITGIDLSENAINIAKLHLEETKTNNINPGSINLKYYVSSVEDFLENNPEQKFDVITCLELLEHVPDPGSIINSIKKLLKPNGTVFLSTLNRNLKSYTLAILGAEYILNLIPKGTHEYNKFIKPSELASLLRNNNLKLNNISGITYNIFNQKFNLSKDTDVNYIICAD